MSLWLDSVSGKGTYLELEDLSVNTGETEKVIQVIGGHEKEQGWRCVTPVNCQKVDFKVVTAAITDEGLLKDMNRSRLRVDMNQSLLEVPDGE